MDGGNVAWTVGAAICGGLVGPPLQGLIMRNRSNAGSSGARGGDLAIDQSRINIQVNGHMVIDAVSSAAEHTTAGTNPAAVRRISNSDNGRDDTLGSIIAITVGGMLLAVFYAKTEGLVLRALVVAAAFSAAFLVSSLLFLVVRGVRFSASLSMQLIGLAVIVAAVFLSITFLHSPPAFNSDTGRYVDLLAIFQSGGSSALASSYGVSGVGFLMYQFLGALLTALLTLLTVYVEIKILAITDLTLGAKRSAFRVSFAAAGPRPAALIISGLLVSTMALLFSSGLLYAWLYSTTSSILPSPSNVTTPSAVVSETDSPTSPPTR